MKASCTSIEHVHILKVCMGISDITWCHHVASSFTPAPPRTPSSNDSDLIHDISWSVLSATTSRGSVLDRL